MQEAGPIHILYIRGKTWLLFLYYFLANRFWIHFELATFWSLAGYKRNILYMYSPPSLPVQ